MSVTVRPYVTRWLGGGHSRRAPGRHRHSRAQEGAQHRARPPPQRWAEARERVLLVQRQTEAGHERGGARYQHSRSSRRGSWTATRGRIDRSRAASRRKRVDLRVPSGSAARRQEAGRNHDRRRAAAESLRSSDQLAEDRQQRADGAERAAEERRWSGTSSSGCRARSGCCRRRRASASFHDFDEFERLVEAAEADAPRTYLVVLLGGEAGLRCGEIMALEWTDVDLAQAAALRGAVRLEGPRDEPEGGPAALRAADQAAGRGAPRRTGICAARGCSANATGGR